MKKSGPVYFLILLLGLVSCDSNESLIDLNYRHEKINEELAREKYLRLRLQAYIDSVMGGSSASYVEEIMKAEPVAARKPDTVFIELPPADNPYVITLATELEKGLAKLLDQHLKIERRGDQVLLVFEEKALFVDNGLLLSQTGRANLKQLAALLKSRPDLFVAIEGHSDTGPLPEELAVKDHETYSYRRAAAVVQALKDDGLSAKQLIAAGGGAAHPIADNQTEAGRYLNRRTVIAVMALGRGN